MSKFQSVLVFLGAFLLMALIAGLVAGGIWNGNRKGQRAFKLMNNCIEQVTQGNQDRAGILLCRYAIYGHH